VLLTITAARRVSLVDHRGNLTSTGGNTAVRALGSTGCRMVASSSASFDIEEFDLILLDVVFCVSTLSNIFVNRDDTLPRWRTED
jgi:hypothetical protein